METQKNAFEKVEIKIDELNRVLHLKLEAGKFSLIRGRIEPHGKKNPKLRLSGPWQSFLRLAGTQSVTEAKQLGLEIEGDATILWQVRRNWFVFQAELENLFPELIQVLQRGKKKLNTIRNSIQENLQEYLEDEAAILVDRASVSHWMNEVDKLRNDVARFEAAYRLLEALKHRPVNDR